MAAGRGLAFAVFHAIDGATVARDGVGDIVFRGSHREGEAGKDERTDECNQVERNHAE
jgi:hypothetical protein